MRVDVHRVIPDELAESCWRLYAEAFEELRWTAVQQHLMPREEFDAMMVDQRILKYLATDETDRLCALSTLTNDLSAVSLVSPDYFRRHWPDHFETGRIWYLIFLGIHPDCRDTGLLELMVREMYQVKGAGHAVAVFDVCRMNGDASGFPQALRRALEPYAGPIRAHRLDEQTYWLYELPAVS